MKSLFYNLIGLVFEGCFMEKGLENRVHIRAVKVGPWVSSRGVSASTTKADCQQNNLTFFFFLLPFFLKRQYSCLKDKTIKSINKIIINSIYQKIQSSCVDPKTKEYDLISENFVQFLNFLFKNINSTMKPSYNTLNL